MFFASEVAMVGIFSVYSQAKRLLNINIRKIEEIVFIFYINQVLAMKSKCHNKTSRPPPEGCPETSAGGETTSQDGPASALQG